jgi:hypothetical protein
MRHVSQPQKRTWADGIVTNRAGETRSSVGSELYTEANEFKNFRALQTGSSFGTEKS